MSSGTKCCVRKEKGERGKKENRRRVPKLGPIGEKTPLPSLSPFPLFPSLHSLQLQTAKVLRTLRSFFPSPCPQSRLPPPAARPYNPVSRPHRTERGPDMQFRHGVTLIRKRSLTALSVTLCVGLAGFLSAASPALAQLGGALGLESVSEQTLPMRVLRPVLRPQGRQTRRTVHHRRHRPWLAHLLDHAAAARSKPHRDQPGEVRRLAAGRRVPAEPGPGTGDRAGLPGRSHRDAHRERDLVCPDRNSPGVAPQKLKITGSLTAQLCQESQCQLPTLPFTAVLGPGGEIPPEPSASEDTLRANIALEDAGTSLWLQLGAAFVGGIILNLMPCVLPVIGLKNPLLRRAGRQ